MDLFAAGIAVLVIIATVLILSGNLTALFGPPIALDPKKKIQLTLIEKEELTKDVRRFRFALPSEKHVLGLPIGKHIMLSYTDGEGGNVGRTYTPVTRYFTQLLLYQLQLRFLSA